MPSATHRLLLSALLSLGVVGASRDAAADGGGSAPDAYALHGTVRDDAGAVVAGAHVEVLDGTDAVVADAVTDTRGELLVPSLRRGAYRVRVSRAGAVSVASVDLGPATGPIDLVLGPTEVRVAGRRTAPPGQTGSSVVAISRKDIQSLPGGDAQGLTQVMLTRPGFAPDTFGPDGVVHVRGAEAGVLYIVDGVQLPTGMAGQFADVLPTRIVQGLRIFTGGIPVEYGPNSGGVVDVATRHGSDRPAGDVQLVYGTYQRVQPSAWYSQAIGNVDVFAQGSFLTTERGLDTPAASPILHDAMTSGNVFTRLDYRPNDHDRVLLIASFAQHDMQIPIDPTLLPLSDAPPGAVRGPDRYGNAPPPFVPYNADPREIERDVFVAGSYVHAMANGTVQLTPYVRSSSSDFTCDASAALGPTADPGSACANVSRLLWHEGQMATFAWKSGERQQWKAGITLDAAQSSVDYAAFTRNDGSPVGGVDPALTLAGRDDTSTVLAGAFVQDEITIGKLKIFPGLRADLQSSTFQSGNEPRLTLGSPSVRLGVSYALSRSLVLHAFAGYLWQPPNAVDAAVAARVLVPGLAGQSVPVDVKAERDEYAELGIAYRESHLAASLTGYGRYAQDQLDVLTVGSTTLSEDYNYAKGRAIGAELAVDATANRYLQGFGNASFNIAQGQGVDSLRYLFSADDLAYKGWSILDHVQTWTANVGVDLHDANESSHLSVLFQYGSGLRTGADNNQTVPDHATWNATLRHRFDFALHPEVAVDVLNVFDTVYAIRIANGFVGSAYAPLRQVDLRLTVPFGS